MLSWAKSYYRSVLGASLLNFFTDMDPTLAPDLRIITRFLLYTQILSYSTDIELYWSAFILTTTTPNYTGSIDFVAPLIDALFIILRSTKVEMQTRQQRPSQNEILIININFENI